MNSEKIKQIHNGKLSKIFIVQENEIKYALKEFDSTQDEIKKLSVIYKYIKTLSHENLVKIIDFSSIGNTFKLLSEYIPSKTFSYKILERSLIDKIKMPIIDRVKILIQVIVCLKYLHDNCIVHRDIKPLNILINENGVAKINDFDFAVFLPTDDVYCKGQVGTPNYISPEVLNNEYYRYSVDIWAIGVILFFIFADKCPFERLTVKDTYAAIRQLDYTIKDEVPLKIKDIIKGIFKKHVDLRLSLNEIEHKLNEYINEKKLI